MCWKYQNLLNVLEMKKNEIEQLSSEFEKCIRAKEVCLCTCIYMLSDLSPAS